MTSMIPRQWWQTFSYLGVDIKNSYGNTDLRLEENEQYVICVPRTILTKLNKL